MNPDHVRNFCDTKMSLRDYDHDLAIRAYVVKFYWHLMTPLERRVVLYIAPITSAPEGHPAAYEYLENRDGHVEDADVLKAFQNSHEERKAAAVERVLRESGNLVQIHCCRACTRVLQTPKAQQCLWCGLDWHHVE